MQTRAFVTRIRGSDPPSLWRGTWPRFTDPCTRRYPRAIPPMVDDSVEEKRISDRRLSFVSLCSSLLRRASVRHGDITAIIYSDDYTGNWRLSIIDIDHTRVSMQISPLQRETTCTSTVICPHLRSFARHDRLFA